MNKLTLEEVEKILSTAKLPITFRLGEQLLDTLRENNLLWQFYRTMRDYYKASHQLFANAITGKFSYEEDSNQKQKLSEDIATLIGCIEPLDASKDSEHG